MRNHLFKSALVVAAGLTLAACATATPYAPASPGNRYGYAEQRVDADRYRVSFSGNSVTSREQVEMGLLLRAAELTVQSGRDWFTTVNRATERDTRVVGSPDPFFYDRYRPYWGPNWRYYRRGAWSPWGPWGRYNDPFFGPSMDYREIDRFEATTEVVFGSGRKPADDPNAFDAREVIDNLGPRVPRAAS